MGNESHGLRATSNSQDVPRELEHTARVVNSSAHYMHIEQDAIPGQMKSPVLVGY